jgi:hypothetical protein
MQKAFLKLKSANDGSPPPIWKPTEWELESQGIVIRLYAGGHLYVFVHPSSTGGVLLELIQE